MINFIDISVNIILCHLVGDFFLQTEHLAKSKGKNWYHLFVHCALYSLPFYAVFGLTWELAVIFMSHMIIDSMKARYKVINYPTDQVLHFIIAFVLYIV